MRGQSTPEEPDRASTSERVAILGLRQAGKSTFLAVLSNALTPSHWKVVPKEGTVNETVRKLNVLRERLMKYGFYPPPTPEGQMLSGDFTFKVTREARFWGLKEGDVFELRADDIPGGPVEGLAGPVGTFREFYEEYVKECAAIIFLIDPQHKWLVESEDQERGAVKEGQGPYLYVFTSILDELVALRGNNLIIAFCITKLDQEPDGRAFFDDSGDRSADEYLDKKAREILGEVVKDHIDSVLRDNPVRWFGVSATGYYVDTDGQWRSQHTRKLDPTDGIERAAIARPNDLKPLGVAEAAEWVFDQVAARHIRARRPRGRFRF